MSELLPLSHGEQKQIFHRRAIVYLDALASADKRKKAYQEAVDAWDAETERAERLLAELGKYLGDQREHVVVVVNGRAYLLRRVGNYTKFTQVPMAK